MLKSEDEAWQLFEILSENSLHHMSASIRDKPMLNPKRGGIYVVGNTIDIHQKIDELSQKLDRLLNTGQSPIPPNPIQEVCALCASPNHFVSECPAAPQFPEFVHEQVQQVQQARRPGNDPYSNTYNPGWRNHPNFSWRPQPVVGPTAPRPQYQDPTYRHGPYHQFQNISQPSTTGHSSAFEEKVLKVLE